MKLDSPSSSHEAARVGQNISGTTAAWAHSRTGVVRVTSASRAPRLAQLRLRASRSKVKLTAVAVLPIPSQIC
jgi:hypothetical protein